MLSVAGLLLLVGCSHGLSKKAAAAQLDEDSKGRGPALFVDAGRVGTKCDSGGMSSFDNEDPTRDFQFIAAEKMGLINIKKDGDSFWKIELTDTGSSASKGMNGGMGVHKNGCDYHLVGFDLGERSPVSVTAVRQLGDDAAEVDYKWTYVANDLAKRMASQLSPEEIAELSRAEKRRGTHQSLLIPDGNQSLEYSGTQKFKKLGGVWKMD